MSEPVCMDIAAHEEHERAGAEFRANDYAGEMPVNPLVWRCSSCLDGPFASEARVWRHIDVNHTTPE